MSCLQVGVTEGKLRRWLLSVTAFLANHNGSIAEAIALWQRNVLKEFEGVEECLICDSIVSASDFMASYQKCIAARAASDFMDRVFTSGFSLAASQTAHIANLHL